MIKDMLVNLSMGDKHPATDYAASLAELSEAHLAGLRFVLTRQCRQVRLVCSPTLVEMAIQENEQAVEQRPGTLSARPSSPA